MLPLLFVCVSQHRPLRVRNPIRCNRRILSQPCFHRSYSPRYPFGAPLRSHLLYLSVPFLSALRNVLCKTSMINTLFLIAFAYSYSSTGNPDCQCSFCCHAIVNVYNGILYKVIFITYIRGYKMKKVNYQTGLDHSEHCSGAGNFHSYVEFCPDHTGYRGRSTVHSPGCCHAERPDRTTGAP